jgi:hypothetical protein
VSDTSTEGTAGTARRLNSYATERHRYLTSLGLPGLLGVDCCVCRQPLPDTGVCTNTRCVAGENHR